MASREAAGSKGGNANERARPPATNEPGEWVDKSESMPPASRKYQAQMAHTPPGKVYRIYNEDGSYVDYDGFEGGVLEEAKGPGLAKFYDENLRPQPFFEEADKMLDQAQQQFKAARGIPIRWIVSEKRMVDALRKMFAANDLQAIEVVHVPAAPYGIHA